MPKQRRLLGRLLFRISNRKLTLLLLGLSLFFFAILVSLTSAVPSTPSLSAYNRKLSVPHISNSLSKSVLNPFRQPSHPPPRRDGNQYAGTSWWADWKWLSVPFSSSVTLDEDRALLPPLGPRQAIYCYYDATAKKTRDEKDAESRLLLTWRRAWWAQGFRPIILSSAEAMNNPSYDRLQRLTLDPALHHDIMRWLAWETMGGGLLAHYTLLPTVDRQDGLLSYLRRGDFPRLKRWQALDDALFAGPKEPIGAVVEEITDPMKPKLFKSATSAVPNRLFEVDKSSAPLSSYSRRLIEKKYPKLAGHFKESQARGLSSLNELINSHLQSAWQSRFHDGIEVLQPYPHHTTTMIDAALKLARRLSICPASPMPATCPPTSPKCTPCIARSALPISTPARYHNSSSVFTIGVVPHPWTLAILEQQKEKLNVTWIRRESPRDPWINTITQDGLGTGVSGNSRLRYFKEAVAGEHATAHSLWLTAEDETAADMSWYFGFAIPSQGLNYGQSESPVPADRFWGKNRMPDAGDGSRATAENVASEKPLLDQAKKVVVQTRPTAETKLRASLEAWSMADTEAWKFVRALRARRAKERDDWEKDEGKYSKGVGTERGRSAWNRWQDRKEDAKS